MKRLDSYAVKSLPLDGGGSEGVKRGLKHSMSTLVTSEVLFSPSPKPSHQGRGILTAQVAILIPSQVRSTVRLNTNPYQLFE